MINASKDVVQTTIIQVDVWHALEIYSVQPPQLAKKVLWLICDNVPSNTYIFSRSLIELETRQYQPPQMPESLALRLRNPLARPPLVLPTLCRSTKLSSLVKVSIFFDGAAFPYTWDVISPALLIFFIWAPPATPVPRVDPPQVDARRIWRNKNSDAGGKQKYRNASSSKASLTFYRANIITPFAEILRDAACSIVTAMYRGCGGRNVSRTRQSLAEIFTNGVPRVSHWISKSMLLLLLSAPLAGGLGRFKGRSIS